MVAVHLVTPIAGIVHIRQAGLQRTAKWLALALYLGLLVISRWLTPPALNINLAFGPYEALPLAMPVWASYLFNILLGFALLVAAERLVERAEHVLEQLRLLLKHANVGRELQMLLVCRGSGRQH